MSLSRLLVATLLLIIPLSNVSSAQEALPVDAKVKSLAVRPAVVELNGPFGYAQLVVTATLDNGDTTDVTRLARYELPKGCTQVAGMIRATSDVAGAIAISLGDQALTVPIKTVGVTASDVPVSFVTDVQPVLSKLGCNAGTCHGAAQGKVGFKLSLRGYDSIFDHRSLTDDLEGRRFNRAAPEKSLMLMKPAGAVPHQGGVMMAPGDPNYELIRRWISQGVKLDLNAVRVKSIAITPKDPTIARIGEKQQFAILATYTDGRVRDVTAESFIDSSNTEVATVDKSGLLTAVRRGESTLLARYEGAYSASTVVVMGDRTGFAWEDRPVHNYIDELIDQKLKKVRVQPSPIADDSEFIRRVYIDLTGLPPTVEEVRSFLEDSRTSRTKRDELIDKLVGNDSFVEHWANKWADLLQVNRKFLGEAGAVAFRKWIREAVASNKPYDKFAFEILTANGSNLENPPASYFKILRAADEAMENTTQLFLAVRFNCNKCHDHPFEKWTQDQYFNLAAYFAQVERKEDAKYKGQRLGATAVDPQGAPLVEIVKDAKTGEIKHERTGATAKPVFPFTIKAQVPDSEPRRTQVAHWITSPSNPYFARSYVNRLWGYLLGMGLIEPLDDIRASNPPTNPALLDKLTDEFIASGFDTRAMIRTICKSRTYQLSLTTNKWNRDDEINYSHAIARRLPAEVLFDTIHRATGSTSRLPGLPAGARAAQLVDSNVELPGGFLELLGKPVRESACECERTGGLNLGPILAMVNGPIVGDAIRDPNNRLNKLVRTEQNDAKVVEEIYLSVVNRFPSSKEKQAGIAAIRAADADHALMLAEHKVKTDALGAYEKLLLEKQHTWETSLRDQKPTAWTNLDVHRAESKHGPQNNSKPGATLTLQKDGSILASGKLDPVDHYTVMGLAELDKPITALRLELLADPSLPANGPGRAVNGNVVVTELHLSAKPLDTPDVPVTLVKTKAIAQTFQQDGFSVAATLDGNRGTGWALAPQFGRDHAAVFKFDKPIAGPAGVAFTVDLEQTYAAAPKHTIGKFRLAVTTDPNPKLMSSLTPQQIALVETPEQDHTPEQKAQLRQMYLAQDKEYQRLLANTANPPPADARILGAQDLVWALINSPGFLFNH